MELAHIAAAILGPIAAVLVAMWRSAKENGSLTATVLGHNKDIEKLEDSDTRQWRQIGEHGERIAAIEGQHRQELNG